MSDVVYQNKDVTLKSFADRFKGKSLKAFGIDLPVVKAVHPTNLPEIAANELRIDNLFELEDGSYALIDYESEYREEDKVKYLNYIARLFERFRQDGDIKRILRMIVIYAADVKRQAGHEVFDAGCVEVHISAAYLSEMPKTKIRRKIEKKIQERIRLSDEELMQLIILPLAYKGNTQKRKSVKELAALANQLDDESQRIFALSGIAVFSDKVIDEETGMAIRRWIMMTKVEMIIEREKEEAVEAERRKKEEAIAVERREKEKAIAEERKEKEKAVAEERAETQNLAIKNVAISLLQKGMKTTWQEALAEAREMVCLT